MALQVRVRRGFFTNIAVALAAVGGAIAPLGAPDWTGAVAAPIVVADVGNALVPVADIRRLIGLQEPPAKGPAPGEYRGNDSCQWAHDGECDDFGLGTGFCAAGTDYSDCWRIAAGVEDNSCQWANDGECDEPHYGTGACAQGTDRNDCGDLRVLRFQTDACPTAFDGVCNEPGLGNGTCEARTDRADCIGRERPMTINDHFFGWDDRVVLDTATAPWVSVGWIKTDDAACTATLVAPDVIVTAAHCIESNGQIDARSVFQTGQGRPGGVLTARVTAYLIAPSRTVSGKLTDESETDWALLRLDRPVGDEVGFVGVRRLADYSANQALLLTLLQAGYSWDTGDNLSGNLDCNIVELEGDRVISHDCDTTRGDSGSPFMIRDGDGYFIVATDSAFDIVPNQPARYVATRADEWIALLPDFAAGRIGIELPAPVK